jgi:hypothetical protein
MQLKKYIHTAAIALALVGCTYEDECTEKLNENCNCQTIADPVCGCNNKTYGNACEAKCAGIYDYTKGVCN